MATKLDARQTISRDLLDQLALVVDKELDDLLRSVNKELTPPFQMHQDTGSNRVIKLEDYTVTNPETLRKHSIPPISNTLPTGITFPIQITFPAASGGTITISGTAFSGAAPTLTISVSNFIKVGFNFDANGNITLTFGTEGASAVAATAPPTVDGMYGIGFVILQNVAGTISNVTNTNIYQYVGSGGSGGSGSGNTILETLKNDFVDSPYELLSPSVISADGNTYVDPSSTATYSLVFKSMSFTATAQTVLSVNMLDTQEFLATPKDVWDTRLAAFWRLANIDTAATYEVSRDGGGHWAIPTMARIGTNTEVYYGDYRWPREEEDSALINYTNGSPSSSLLSNVAGANEAVAQKIVFTARTRVTSLALSLFKAGAITGSYRYVIYSDNTGPSSRLFTGAWVDVTTLGTSGALATYDASAANFYMEANVNYWFALETDDAYKASFINGSTCIKIEFGTGFTNESYVFDNGLWSVLTLRLLYNVVGGQESFIAQAADVSADNNGVSLDATPAQKLSEIFTLTNPASLKKVVLRLDKLGAATGGNVYLQFVTNNAGSPSTVATDVKAESSAIDISALSTGITDVTFLMPTTPLAAGSYHLVLRTDSTYKTSATVGYSAGVRELRWRGNTASTPAGKRFDGTTWNALGSPMGFKYSAQGRVLDLRMRVTSSASNKLLDAFAMYYSKEITGVSGGILNLQKFNFLSATNNTNEFQITAFTPNPDFLRVYHVERAKTYIYGAFSFQGSKIVFPVNFFYNAGVDENVTLVCTQFEGAAYDNSDRNALLLANNFLGSTDATVDRSQAGRGIFLRRPDGTLREIAIDDNDSITIFQV